MNNRCKRYLLAIVVRVMEIACLASNLVFSAKLPDVRRSYGS